MSALPYVEQQTLFAMYSYRGMYVSWDDRYGGVNNTPVTGMRLSAFTCPSDVPQKDAAGSVAMFNYACNYGNTGYTAEDTGPVATYGTVTFGGAPFTMSGSSTLRPLQYGFRDITDGTSNTLMFAEVVEGVSASAPPNNEDLRGYTYWGGAAGFSSIIPPNSSQPDVSWSSVWCIPADNPPCIQYSTSQPAALGSRSRHPGGVNTARCDASVAFVSDNIAIDVWRALSTTHGGETISANAY